MTRRDRNRARNKKRRENNKIIYRGMLPITNKGFINLTSKKLPHNMIAILSYGPKFEIPIKNVPIREYLQTMGKIHNILEVTNPFHKKRNFRKIEKVFERNLRIKKTEKEALIIKNVEFVKKMMTKNRNLHIVEADKGKVSILMYKNTYEAKVLEHINTNIKNATYMELTSNEDDMIYRLKIMKAFATINITMENWEKGTIKIDRKWILNFKDSPNGY